MKIIAVEPCTGEDVETNEGEHIRYSADCWYTRFGGSFEVEYHYEELEAAYQSYLNNNE